MLLFKHYIVFVIAQKKERTRETRKQKKEKEENK